MKKSPILLAAYLILSVATLVLLSQIALTTTFNAHPDEYDHLDAFCYFEDTLWPPDLSADGLVYSPYGWSRVYSQEIAYPLFALLSAPTEAALRGLTSVGILPAELVWREQRTLPMWNGTFPADCSRRLIIYRFINIGLLGITLLALFWWGRKQPWLLLVGLTILSIPQAVYMYGYANNDALGLSAGAFLLIFALTQRRLLAARRAQIGLGLLTGLMLLSKQSFWPVLVLVGWILLRNLNEDTPGWYKAPQRRALITTALLGGLTALAVIAPFQIIYPLTQGDYDAREYEMRMERAAEGFQPDDYSQPGFKLAQRGVPFSDVALSPSWYKRSGASFYAVFGYLSVSIDSKLYKLVLGLWLLNAGITLGFLFTKTGRALPWQDKATYLAAIVTIGLSILASLFYSWSHDYQPQGRYLFAAVAPLAIVLWGSIPNEQKWLRRGRLGALLALAALSLGILWFYIVASRSLS